MYGYDLKKRVDTTADCTRATGARVDCYKEKTHIVYLILY